MMNTDLHDFEQFMKRREEASVAYVQGDAEPLSRIVARVSPATFFPPRGGYQQGAADVASTYEHDAALFEPGSESRFEVLHMAASDGIAYWVGFMRSTVRMRGSAEAIPMNLRTTEVFRREGGEWKLIHRHADMLMSPPAEKKQ
jgi:ketosteroid isomerase-like protein